MKNAPIPDIDSFLANPDQTPSQEATLAPEQTEDTPVAITREDSVAPDWERFLAEIERGKETNASVKTKCVYLDAELVDTLHMFDFGIPTKLMADAILRSFITGNIERLKNRIRVPKQTLLDKL